MNPVPQLIATAFPQPAPPIDGSGPCALCGNTDHAAHLKRYIKSTTADLADTFRFGDDWLCQHCAMLFGNSHFTGSFIVLDGVGIRPMVATASATAERPAWRDLIPSLQHGQQTVTLMTSNTKRRLWPRAIASTVGPVWQFLFVDGDTDRIVSVDFDRLLRCLSITEHVYSLGISKSAISTSLFNAPMKQLMAIGLDSISALERELIVWRGTDELIVSTFIAQKETP